MTLAPWPVLYEDNHLLVVNKPALLPTMGVAADRESLIAQAKQYIGRKYNKPGDVYLGIVSRLDAPVTGVVVMARTSKAAARLTEQFRTHQVEKIYWAMVEGTLQPPAGRLIDTVVKDERHRRMHIATSGLAGGQEARLGYRTLQTFPHATLVEVQLETGRKHQIRLQLSHAGAPIVGDRKYRSEQPFGKGIALHARRLALVHPVKREPLEFVAPLPASWRVFGQLKFSPDGDAN
jgi:23S rRNA pseudouridine1911/1915/1917 synthase